MNELMLLLIHRNTSEKGSMALREDTLYPDVTE